MHGPWISPFRMLNLFVERMDYRQILLSLGLSSWSCWGLDMSLLCPQCLHIILPLPRPLSIRSSERPREDARDKEGGADVATSAAAPSGTQLPGCPGQYLRSSCFPHPCRTGSHMFICSMLSPIQDGGYSEESKAQQVQRVCQDERL